MAAVLSVVVKESLYRVTYRIGVNANSNVTVANAIHHRSDALSSVVAFIGIGAGMAGSLLGLNLTWCDPLAGAAVAVMIGKGGVHVCYHFPRKEMWREAMHRNTFILFLHTDSVPAETTTGRFETSVRQMQRYFVPVPAMNDHFEVS